MRSDDGLNDELRDSTEWKDEDFVPSRDVGRNSISGHERNHLFVNARGKSFSDVSLVSGLDTQADSRAFVLWDFDRDGRQDIALVNANTPLLTLYRNSVEGSGRMIALRFVGSAAGRDGYGAKVLVTVGERTLLREHRCGEGFAAQNSATMIVGIGDQAQADVTVRWPGGSSQTIRAVPAGTLLTAHEKDASFASERYRKLPREAAAGAEEEDLRLALPGAAGPAKLRLFTTMATWCQACRNKYPQLAALRARHEDVAIYGVPVDAKDDRTKLERYAAEHRPPYAILMEVGQAERDVVKDVLRATVQRDALPSTIVTDADGRVVEAFAGIPTESDIRRLLDGR